MSDQRQNIGEYFEVEKVRYAFLHLKMLALVPSDEGFNDEQKN